MKKQITESLDLQSSFKFEELNITAIAYVYMENMMLSKDVHNIDLELDQAIIKISSDLESGSTQSQSNKLKSLQEALKKIKKHSSSLESNIETESYKNDIKETLAVYKDYFLIKFSKDGDADNCDPVIKKILLNFDDKSPLFSSINSSNDENGLNKLRFEINGYLATLTILAESTIHNNASDPNYNSEQQEKYVDAIKTNLLTFPGDATDVLQNDHNCVQGTRQRIQNAIFKSKKLSQESESAKHNIDKSAVQLFQKVEEGLQIHTPPSLLGSLVMNREGVAKIDNFYSLPQKNIPLHQIIDFSHTFAQKITKDLLDLRGELIDKYSELLQGTSVGDEKVATFDSINAFVDASKISGFNFDANDLIKEDCLEISSTIKISDLISLHELTIKYLQIPTDKFKEELSKIKDETSPTVENLPKTDYLKHLPDPQNLFKTHKSKSPESIDIETLTSRLDVKKVKNLVSLFPRTGTASQDDYITKKSKMSAGLITLRNILDGYDTNDNTYFYFLKFAKKFGTETGESFEKFFYEKRNEKLEVKAEFSEEKSMLETIKTRIESQKGLIYGNLTETTSAQLISFIGQLLSLEDFEKEENKMKFIALLNENNIAIKNNSGENLLNILYQFDEKAFEKALEIKPELIQTIKEKDNEDLSLIQKLVKKDLTQKDNEEFLLEILEKYKENSKNQEDPSGTKALIKMINEELLLIYIALKNNSDIFEKIIKTTANEDAVTIDFNKADFRGDTILSFACQKGNTKIVEALIKNGADLNKANEHGETPLFTACSKGHTKIVEALIKAGADLIKANEHGETPLFAACLNGHTKIVEALIKSEADLEYQNNGFRATPLFAACSKGHTKIVEALIEARADLNKANVYEATPLFAACLNGHTKIVEALIEAGADLIKANEHEETPLFAACYKGHTKIVEALIKAGADLNKANEYEETPLFAACLNGHAKIVEALIKAGADLNKANVYEETPLSIALKNGHIDVVKALIQNGAHAFRDDDTIIDETNFLFNVCKSGDIEIFKALIKAEAKEKILFGQTLLNIACYRGHTEIVEALIEAGADSNKANPSNGVAPLFAACLNGHTEIVEALIEAGADLNKVNPSNGKTPLFVAYSKGHTEIVEALIKAGADLEKAPTPEGESFLHVACQNGHAKIVEALIERNNDKTYLEKTRTSDGATPLLIACKKGDIDTIKALFDGGADINFLKQKINLSYFFSGSSENKLKFDQSGATPEVQKLIKKITDPKEIEIRDQNLRQVAFNKKNDELLKFIAISSATSRSLSSAVPFILESNISEITLAVLDSSPQAIRNEDTEKEVTNCLLFLKFIALEFSSQKKSTLIPDQKISKMLAIYLKNNEHHASFIAPIIDNVIANKNDLQSFLTVKSAEELITLSRENPSETSSTQLEEYSSKSKETIIKEKLEKIISQSLTKKTTPSPTIDAEFFIDQPPNRSGSMFSCLPMKNTRVVPQHNNSNR